MGEVAAAGEPMQLRVGEGMDCTGGLAGQRHSVLTAPADHDLARRGPGRCSLLPWAVYQGM